MVGARGAGRVWRTTAGGEGSTWTWVRVEGARSSGGVGRVTVDGLALEIPGTELGKVFIDLRL